MKKQENECFHFFFVGGEILYSYLMFERNIFQIDWRYIGVTVVFTELHQNGVLELWF